MNDSSLDRDLRDLFAAGPREAPPTVVERALEGARREQQRRPRFTLLDTRAWPPQPRSVADPTVHRALRVIAVAALVVVLGVVIAVGARLLDRPPSLRVEAGGTLDALLLGPRAMLWPDGRVLILGQGGTAYLYDPATAVSTRTTFGPGFSDPSVAVLPDGRVVLTQARDSNGPSTSVDVAFLDPATGQLTRVGAFDRLRFGESTLVLRDGRILISGGVVFPETTPPCPPSGCEGQPEATPDASGDYAGIRVFDPASGSTSELAPMAGGRYQHSMLELPDGRILIVGGARWEPSAEVTEVEVYDLASQAATIVGTIEPGRGPFQLPPVQLTNGSVVIPGGGSIEFLCGAPSPDTSPPIDPPGPHTVVRQPTYVFDPSRNSVAAGPLLPHFFGLPNIIPLNDGRALAFGYYWATPAGCVSEAGAYEKPWLGVIDLGRNTVFESYNPMTGVATIEFDATRVYGAGVLLGDGRVALIGDDIDQLEENAIDLVTVDP